MVPFSGNGATVTLSTMLTSRGCPYFQMGVAQQRPVPIQQHPGCVQSSQGQGLNGIYAPPLIRFCVLSDKVSRTLLLLQVDMPCYFQQRMSICNLFLVWLRVFGINTLSLPLQSLNVRLRSQLTESTQSY